MASILRSIALLYTSGAAFGVRRLEVAIGGAQGFPARSWTAAGAIIGQGVQHGVSGELGLFIGRPAAAAPKAPAAVDMSSAFVPQSSTRLMAAADAALASLPSHWRKNLVNVRQIARSMTAIVLAARLRKNPEQSVLVKRVMPQTEAQVYDLLKEIRFLKLFKNTPGIVTLYRAEATGTLAPGHEVLLLFEHTVGNLRDQVLSKSFNEVPVETRVRLFMDVVRAVRDMETARVSHRNVTPDNILIVGDCRSPEGCNAVLSDFRNAHNLPGSMVADYTGSQVEGMAANPDYASLITILRLMLLNGRTEADSPHSAADNSEFEVAFGEKQHIFAGLVGIWQAMTEPSIRMHFPLEQVLEAVEALAAATGVNLSPRKVPKLKGWSKLRSSMRAVIMKDDPSQH
mmetsp:Transcript_7848/g.22543  ORF Transcript_7848/g.22543 Transcript_7848/m.22543 type:complete len:400 (+) Transcript_7848:76-1275(+)